MKNFIAILILGLLQNPGILGQKKICKHNFYENNEVDIYFGTAQFLSAKKIEILEKKRTISANYFIIATGTSPYRPPRLILVTLKL